MTNWKSLPLIERIARNARAVAVVLVLIAIAVASWFSRG